MKTENKLTKHNDAKLEAEIAELTTEVKNLQTKAADLEKKLIMVGGINNKCSHCEKKTGTIIDKGQPKGSQIRTIDYYHYKCENKDCGKEYYKQYPID